VTITVSCRCLLTLIESKEKEITIRATPAASMASNSLDRAAATEIKSERSFGSDAKNNYNNDTSRPQMVTYHQAKKLEQVPNNNYSVRTSFQQAPSSDIQPFYIPNSGVVSVGGGHPSN
jgi:hypothetical protein